MVNIDGEIVVMDSSPKFKGWMKADFVKEYKAHKELRYIEAMSAQELEKDKLAQVIESDEYWAEEKFNGHRCLTHQTYQGNRLFSKRLSKESGGWYSENTDTMPHIRDNFNPAFLGTITDSEITVPIPGCDHRTVQSVTGSLADNALNWQLEHEFAESNLFDLLFYKKVNLMNFPYWKRKWHAFLYWKQCNNPFIHFAKMYMTLALFEKVTKLLRAYVHEEKLYKEFLDNIVIVSSIMVLYNKMLKEGKEGLILKKFNAPYEQKVSKYSIKMKAMKTYDCIIVGYEDAEMKYKGKELSKWEFWADQEGKPIPPRAMSEIQPIERRAEIGWIPVTKWYYKGWIGSIKYGVWKSMTHIEVKAFKGIIKGMTREGLNKVHAIIELGKCSGMDEELRAEISRNKVEFIGQVIEVKAQGILDKKTGTLQNPRISFIRDDKGPEKCTWENHIREY